jgi:hypothetical protein
MPRNHHQGKQICFGAFLLPSNLHGSITGPDVVTLTGLRTREGSSGFRKMQRVGGHGSTSQQADHRECNDTGNRRYNAEGYDSSSRIGFRKFGIV